MLSEESSRRNPVADLDADTPFFVANPCACADAAPTLRGLILPSVRPVQNSFASEFVAVVPLDSIQRLRVAFDRDVRFAPFSLQNGALRSENIGTSPEFDFRSFPDCTVCYSQASS